MSVPFPSGGRRRGSHHRPGPDFIRHLAAHFHELDDDGAAAEFPEPPGAPPPFPAGFRPRGGPRGGRRGFGPPGAPGMPGGFGPGGWAPGPGFPPGFRPGQGWRGGRGGGRGGRRGNVRAAVLALLAEEPRHGYAIMTELAERSRGLWRPSPGSVYPVLQQLQDEGLVWVEESEGRRVFSLTDTGREYIASHADEVHEPWNVGDDGPAERLSSIMFAVQALGAAADQVARTADDAQAEQAVAVLESARKSLYRILAGEPD